MKEQTRNTEVQINEEEIGKLPEKEFRMMTVKMIKNLENKIEKMQESINKDLEELKNKHTETNNTITEIKNTLEGINFLPQRIFPTQGSDLGLLHCRQMLYHLSHEGSPRRNQ